MKRSSAGIHDLEYVFGACGFDWVPESIDRALLLNVAFEPDSGAIALYVLDRSRRFVHKIARGCIVRQYEAEAAGFDPRRLSEFVGCELDFDHILIDAVEGDDLYVNVDAASRLHYVRFLEALCARLGMTARGFLDAVGAICGQRVASFTDCFRARAIALLRVPTGDGTCKIYSRPFAIGNEIPLSPQVIEFLCNVHACRPGELNGFLKHFWTAVDLTTRRVVVGTQHDALLG